MTSNKRYQECSIWEKIKRHRSYLPVLPAAIKLWIICRIKNNDLGFDECLSIKIGMAETNMNWYYTMEEVNEMFFSKKTKLPTAAKIRRNYLSLSALGRVISRAIDRRESGESSPEELLERR